MAAMTYMQFLWNSKNAHGVHSPFVYNIISKCFYNKIQPLYRKQKDVPAEGISLPLARLLHKLVVCSRASKLYVLGDEAAGITEVLRVSGEAINTRPWFFSPLAPIPGAVDLAYISAKDTASLMPLYENILPNIDENSIAVIGNIHLSEETETAWEAIKNHPQTVVTIDTYYAGLVFTRKKQAKQHFIIRCNKNIITDAVLGIRNLWGLLG